MKKFKMAKTALVLVVLLGLVRFPCAAQERTLESSSVKESLPPLPPLDLPLMDPTSVPESGTFFMATHAASADGSMPPWPFNPLSSLEVPVYWLGSYDNTGDTSCGFMMVDDRMVGSVEKALAAMQMLERASKGLPLVEPTIALRSTAPPPSTNDLWLQLHDDDMTNGFVRLTLHNTIEYWPYQLLVRTNLGLPDEWTLGEIISGAYATNQTDFSAIAIGETNQMLFRAHHAEATVTIFASVIAYEAVGGFPWQEGAFTVLVTSTNNVTVHYRVSGTASNGVDYTNLTGSVTIPAGTGSAEIWVRPISDGIIEGDETVVLTLVQTNSYLISGSPTATVLLSESSTVIYPYASSPTIGVEPNGPPGISAQEPIIGLARSDDRGLFPDLDVYYQVSGTASNGVDYSMLNGLIHFANGVSDTNITIVPFADSIMEGVETVTVTVVQSNGYRPYAVANATLTITDTTTTISVGSTSSNSCIELDGPIGIPARPGFVSFSRTDTRGQFPEMDVFYQVSGNTTNGLDYASLSGVFHFGLDVASNNLAIVPLADPIFEGSETVIVTLLPANGYLVSGATSGAVTISDSSTTVRVGSTVSNSCIEPNGPPGSPATVGAIAFSRTDTRGQLPEMDVFYRVTGTASNGTDFAALNGVFHFGLNVSSNNLSVVPLADTLWEGAESVIVTLFPTNGYLNTAGSTGQVAILDSSTTVKVLFGTNATEPNPASPTAGLAGFFAVSRTDSRSQYPALTVQYQVSGTAIPGTDFTNLSGTVTFLAGAAATNVLVQPMADIAVEGNETVKLTLLPTDDYFVDTNFASATVSILDNQPTNMFVPVVYNLAVPFGIDYHAPSNSLIVSASTIRRIYQNASSNTVVANWSGAASGEGKIATVHTNAGGFTVGDTFFESATGIGWLSANGTTSNLNWCVLTNQLVTTPLPRKSLHVDRTGVFGFDLIAVTSFANSPTSGPRGVWRINSQGQPTLLTNLSTLHLEGVVTLPNDIQKWGPWAGKIITGDELAAFVYAISPDGTVTSYNTGSLFLGGIQPDDFDIIPPNQSLYGCDPGVNRIVKLSANYLTNCVGDLLITDAGEHGFSGAQCFIVHWDAATTNFVTRRLFYKRPDGSAGEFEHVTFAPIDLQPQ